MSRPRRLASPSSIVPCPVIVRLRRAVTTLDAEALLVLPKPCRTTTQTWISASVTSATPEGRIGWRSMIQLVKVQGRRRFIQVQVGDARSSAEPRPRDAAVRGKRLAMWSRGARQEGPGTRGGSDCRPVVLDGLASRQWRRAGEVNGDCWPQRVNDDDGCGQAAGQVQDEIRGGKGGPSPLGNWLGCRGLAL
jgi:hypothetical protein